MAFDAAPGQFASRFAGEETGLALAIDAARKRLPSVALGDAALERIAAVCASFDVDGLRADIVIARTAVAHAAWSSRDAVTRDDIRVAARLALPHRRRRDPFDAPGLDERQLDEALGDDDLAADDQADEDLRDDSRKAGNPGDEAPGPDGEGPGDQGGRPPGRGRPGPG